MIYTTCLRNIYKLPKESIKLIIMRFEPKINLLELDNVHFIKSLSPSEELLMSYKNKKIIWKEFSIEFEKQIKNNGSFEYWSNKFKNTNKDVFLICIEQSQFECHRSIISRLLNEKNIECSEFIIKN